MNRRIVLATFDNESSLLEATRESRESGLKIVDAFTPYAVHGLDRAMGLRPSRLPWVCFVAALVGATLKLWFEFWTSMVDWPLDVGGKPWNSLPAFVPVTFEVMVLSAHLTTVFAFFVLVRLWPAKRPVLPCPRITDDRFVLVLEETGAQFDFTQVRRMLEGHDAVEVEERYEGRPEVSEVA
jgi:ActD protein